MSAPATGRSRAAPVPATSHPRRRSSLRLVLVLPAALALLAGLDAALLLLDLPAPVSSARLPEVHGVLLVLGFVGTLVALERAVALRHPAGYTAPAFLGLGAVALLSPFPVTVGAALLVLGTVALVGVYVPLWRRQADESVLVQGLGAVLATGAALLWLGGTAVPALLPWLVGFVVLTIGGERLELARLAMGPSAGPLLVGLAAAVCAGVVASLLWPQVGTVLLGAALLALGGWLATHDVARRTVTGTGLPRYMAACMLAAYAWLGVAGTLWLAGGSAAGAAYDAVVHTVFLGFTLSMIMAHAPVILPAVLRRPLPYHRALWLPVLLLHGSLVVRLWLGDALEVDHAWRIGGVLNIVSVLLFAALVVWRVAGASSKESS
ncbi:MAG: hypothetical protein Q8Q02_14955 [Nocardioides sp.]|nr:hypothetical protein [Nocardioides sp.]